MTSSREPAEAPQQDATAQLEPATASGDDSAASGALPVIPPPAAAAAANASVGNPNAPDDADLPGRADAGVDAAPTAETAALEGQPIAVARAVHPLAAVGSETENTDDAVPNV